MAESATFHSIRQKYEVLASLLHEKAQRHWAACEARALGRGGISLVAAATGISRPTIRRGLAELHTGPAGGDDPDPQHVRIRRPGGDRQRPVPAHRPPTPRRSRHARRSDVPPVVDLQEYSSPRGGPRQLGA